VAVNWSLIFYKWWRFRVYSASIKKYSLRLYIGFNQQTPLTEFVPVAGSQHSGLHTSTVQ